MSKTSLDQLLSSKISFSDSYLQQIKDEAVYNGYTKFEKLIEEKNPVYPDDGNTFLKHWSREIHRFYRFNCVICNPAWHLAENFTMNLQAHHILPKEDYPQHAFELWNGMCLCSEHHGKAHALYNQNNLSNYLKKLAKMVESK